MEDETLWFLLGIVLLFVISIWAYLIVDYCELKEFKECFDTSFDSVECKKYLNY